MNPRTGATELIVCRHCKSTIEDGGYADLDNCPSEIWDLYDGDVQDIDLAWQDEWGYICEDCKYPPSPFAGEPPAKRAYLKAKKLFDESCGWETPPPVCPECGFAFRGGWSRLKQHWDAKHDDAEPYSEGLGQRISTYTYFDKQLCREKEREKRITRLLPERSWLRRKEELEARKRQARRTTEPGKHFPQKGDGHGM